MTHGTGGHHHHHHHAAEGAMAGAGAGVGLGTAEHHHHHHGHHNVTGGATTVDTPQETVGEKIKKVIPGTSPNVTAPFLMQQISNSRISSTRSSYSQSAALPKADCMVPA